MGNDKFISTLDVHTIPEEVFVKEASPECEEQGGEPQPYIDSAASKRHADKQ